jgi:hypothetical protein
MILSSSPTLAAEKWEDPNPQSDVWQYSVPMGTDSDHRAYLWIPQQCKHVRGVLIGAQNMQEEPFFQDALIRKTCAECGLGIVWFSPGDDMGAHVYKTFSPGAADGVQKALADLAVESGYSEIENAPLLVTAHSASTPFIWGMADPFASRVFALLPLKGWFPGHVPSDVPILYVSSEYAEVGGANWGETYLKDRADVARLRADGPDRLIGEAADIGAGHYEWDPVFAPVIAMFIRKAAEYRLPDDGPLTGPVPLKPIGPMSGWLIDPATLGTPRAKPVARKDWHGDPAKGLWYFDREMAQTVSDFIAANVAKKPQVIDFLDNRGQPVPLSQSGVSNLDVTWLPDNVTFKVAATYLDKSPIANLYNGETVGNSSAPIKFKVSTGAIKQTGPDAFRVWMHRGGLAQQGSPWEPTIMAYSDGDSQYRRADRPGHPWLYTINGDGVSQTVSFSAIADVRATARSITLHATASSGLPVQFYVVSGPVALADDNVTLTFLPIPPRSKYPVRVIVAAYQWGRPVDPKIQNAPLTYQEFHILRGH